MCPVVDGTAAQAASHHDHLAARGRIAQHAIAVATAGWTTCWHPTFIERIENKLQDRRGEFSAPMSPAELPCFKPIMALDSAGDVMALHPDMFSNSPQTEMAWHRAGFKRQKPISNLYRRMSLRSDAY